MFRDINKPEKIGSLQGTPFETGMDYFAPSKRELMTNYQVQNIEGMVEKGMANGVTLLDEIVEYDFGKFVHLMDADGNKLELWEPKE